MLEMLSKHGHPLFFFETVQRFKCSGSWFLIGYRNNSVMNEILPGSVSWECHSSVPLLRDNVIFKSFIQGFICVCHHESISVWNQGWKCDLKMNFCGSMCESCHFDRALHDDFSVKFWMFVLIFFSAHIKIRYKRNLIHLRLKVVFSEKATKIDEIFTFDLTLTT